MTYFRRVLDTYGTQTEVYATVKNMSETLGVVGSGTMGAGIAQVAARAGYDVVMRDVAEEFLARGMAAIDQSLQRDVDKDRLSTDAKGAIVARIKTTTDIGALGKAFIVVEAATEDLKIKSDIFRSLDQVTKPDAILVRKHARAGGKAWQDALGVSGFTRLHFESRLAAYDQ